jgi:acyl-coenzyme A thioesterase PaaI-like protein
MTGVDEQVNQHDLETPDSIQARFEIEYVESRPADAEAVLSMPMQRFRNPHTGAPTVGPLAILVDAAAGIVNHYRRRNGQWTVSSELSMDLSPDLGDLDGPVVAAAGLELAASAAINRDRSSDLLQTASLRVNFLRPFFAGAESRYEGTRRRVGRSTAVGDARAIGDDGTAAITARVTAYR